MLREYLHSDRKEFWLKEEEMAARKGSDIITLDVYFDYL